ncbi:MAG: hypothetical protein ACRYFS_06845 [Janthinobacterium lividum]
MNEAPHQIAVWTDDGRADSAAEVALIPRPDGSVQISVEAHRASVTDIVIRWGGPLEAGARILGDHWERGYGDLEWRGVVPERTLPWYALIHDPKTGETQGVGVETGAASFASWRIDQTGISLVLDVRCGGKGVQLGGRRLTAATIRELMSGPGETPFAFARRFCRALCRAPRLPSLPIYGGNDWYSRYGGITSETVKQDSTLIRELSPNGGNAPSFVIDAGWYPTDQHDGAVYDHGNTGFPDLPGLADWMRGIGIRPGIWIRPLLRTEDVPQSWRVSPQHPLAQSPGVFLDPSVPEVLELIRADFERLAGWGYGLIKQDFTTYDITGRWGMAMTPNITTAGWSFADRTRTTAEIITNLYKAIRLGAGDAQIIGCNTVGHLAAGLFEIQRTGDDTSGKHWERTRKMGVNSLAFRMPQHGTFFCADADCVGLKPEIPWDQNRLWLDLLSRSGTALFVSAHPDATGPEQRTALKEAFSRAALPAAPAEPMDWLDTTCPSVWRFGDAGETQTYDWHPFPGSSFACPP